VNLIKELRYQTKYLLWNIPRIMKARFTSGITKYLLDGELHSSTTYSGKAEGRCLLLNLKPLCIHIREEGKPPEIEADEANPQRSAWHRE
jgi:hypothetical protein